MLVLSRSAAVAAAARSALVALWSASVAAIAPCLHRCYACTSQRTANAHFMALVSMAKRGARGPPPPREGGLPAISSISAQESRHGLQHEGSDLEAKKADLEAGRVPLMLLALCKLADPSEEVRGAAEELLLLQGGAANERAPAGLVGEGLPWSAPQVQLALCRRLAASQPRLAAAVVAEGLHRARDAPAHLAMEILDFLAPWTEQAALRLLMPGAAAEPPPPARPPPIGVPPSAWGSEPAGGDRPPSAAEAPATEGGFEGGARALVSLLLHSTLHHLTKGHASLARPLHTLWRSLAAKEGCVRPLLGFLLSEIRAMNALDMSGAAGAACADDADAAAAAGAVPAAGPGSPSSPAEPAAPGGGSMSPLRGPQVLEACRAVMLAISSAQPGPSARILAQQLAPPANLDDGTSVWPDGVHPEAIEAAVAAPLDGLESFSAPAAVAVCSFRADSLGGQFGRGGVSRGGLGGAHGAPAVLTLDEEEPPPEPAWGALAAAAASHSLCSAAEAALLLLSSCVDASLATLLADAYELPEAAATAEAVAESGWASVAGSTTSSPRSSRASTRGSAASPRASRELEASAQPPPPSHAPPPVAPPRGELLAFLLHTAVLLRMHGRGALPCHAGRLLARLVSVSEVRSRASRRTAAAATGCDGPCGYDSPPDLMHALLLPPDASGDVAPPTGDSVLRRRGAGRRSLLPGEVPPPGEAEDSDAAAGPTDLLTHGRLGRLVRSLQRALCPKAEGGV